MSIAMAVPPSQLNFDPPQIEIGLTELLPVGLDYTEYVNTTQGETITAVAVTVTDIASHAALPTMVSGTPQIAEALVQLWLDGSVTTPGRTYRLEATISKSTGARMAGKLQILATY